MSDDKHLEGFGITVGDVSYDREKGTPPRPEKRQRSPPL
jgi:hypothetical protein